MAKPVMSLIMRVFDMALMTLYSPSPYYLIHRGDIYMKLKNAESALKDCHKACDMNVTGRAIKPRRPKRTNFQNRRAVACPAITYPAP